MSPRTQIQNEKIRDKSTGRILTAAFKLMAKNGFESTSIAQIAKEAGVSKGLMYNYFSSKEELLQAIINRTMREGDEMIASLYSDNPVVTLENVFKWFFNELRNKPSEWRFASEIMLKADKYTFVKEMVTAKMNEYMKLIGSLLTELRYKNPEQEAYVIGALFDGIGFGYLVVGENYPIDEIEKYLIEKYCRN